MKIPKINENSFTCPHCNTLTQQNWINKVFIKVDTTSRNYGKFDEYDVVNPSEFVELATNRHHCDIDAIPKRLGDMSFASCHVCLKISIWIEKKMIYPKQEFLIQAHQDMPSDVKELFDEAREVFNLSPRAAGALLRLGLQILLKHLGSEDKGINEDIKYLVRENKIDIHIQQALDAIRVIGNECVHPGIIVINESSNEIMALFEIMNFIVEDTISKKKKIKAIYGILPSDKIKAIDKRDKIKK